VSSADGARQLAWLADGVVMRVLRLAEHEVAGTHGRVPGARFAVIGYGSLGGEELGFGSDLDLVFIYDAPGGEHAHSDGARPLEATRWFARVAQKVVALLGAVTGAGRLYDIDVRLRPDGAKGLLVSSLPSYRDYQRERAWTWEHQALVRARFVAGDESLGADVEDVRRQTLSRQRDVQRVCEDVVAMRRRMRAELDRSDASAFDLKQGKDGLVDLEFLLQYAVLAHSAQHLQWLSARNTRELIHVIGQAGWLDEGEVASLTRAHAVLIDAGLACTLDRRPRRLPLNDAIQQARDAIGAATRRHGLVFDA
jgi:glutamate-ammonia-ligase adenylyltransferase